MPSHINLSGQTFNGIRVVAVSHVDKRHTYHYRCTCHCGRECVLNGESLKRGSTKSCGCLPASIKHGNVGTTEHSTWAAMKGRCLNKNSPAYADYGGRGIRVCERWLDFRNFLEDMGRRPSKAHTIDRIDNDGNYEPGNVRWATHSEQCRNRRSNVLLTHAGRSMCLSDWAIAVGMQRATLERRLKKGWSLDDALNTPVRPMARKSPRRA